MKIGIISDTHRDIGSIDKSIPYLKECDLIIHAGDNIDDAEYIYYSTDVDVKCVKGNCDSYSINEPYELEFSINNKKFFLCHGHSYDVKYGLQSLLKLAKENNIDFVIYGHTHIPLYETIEDIVFINPGSITQPRGGNDKTFGILNLENNISYEFIKI